MGAGRARPGLALAVGGRPGLEGRPPDLGARCLAGAADGHLRRVSPAPPPAAASPAVHRPLEGNLRSGQLLGTALSVFTASSCETDIVKPIIKKPERGLNFLQFCQILAWLVRVE